MIVYNTTYTLPNEDARHFVIWMHQVYFPRVAEQGLLTHPRMLRILSHKDEATECFSIQFDVESTAALHTWYTAQGQQLAEELQQMFDQRVTGFSTLMEEIEG